MKVSLLLRSVILSRDDDEGFLTISDYGDLAAPKWSEILLPRLRDQDDRKGWRVRLASLRNFECDFSRMPANHSENRCRPFPPLPQ